MKMGRMHAGKVIPMDSRNNTDDSYLGDTTGVRLSQREFDPVFDPNPKKFNSIKNIFPPAATVEIQER